jgi:hypothetical protein
VPSVQDLLPSDEKMPSQPGSITENPVDMDFKKDDPAQQSKRKKELNNSRENQQGFFYSAKISLAYL